jgi:hypothetical protein
MLQIDKDIIRMDANFNQKRKELKDVLNKTVSLDGLMFKLQDKMVSYMQRKM